LMWQGLLSFEFFFLTRANPMTNKSCHISKM